MGIEQLKNEVITKVLGDKEKIRDCENLFFKTESSRLFRMWHPQDCCESVYVEDVVGDFSWLIGEKIVDAYETSGFNEVEYGQEQWTFYTISTFLDSVTIRWLGDSNGYYSTAVYFEEVTDFFTVYDEEYYTLC